jgi:hypothetical protein
VLGLQGIGTTAGCTARHGRRREGLGEGKFFEADVEWSWWWKQSQRGPGEKISLEIGDKWITQNDRLKPQLGSQNQLIHQAWGMIINNGQSNSTTSPKMKLKSGPDR